MINLPRLDDIDFQIISDLQDNGRMTNVKLAENAGISAPPCLRRLKTLEERSIIRGYHADVAPDLLGFNIIAFLFVSLIKNGSEHILRFEATMNEHSLVRECYVISGVYDFLLKTVVREQSEHDMFVGFVKSQENVKKIETNLVICRSKWLAGVPLKEAGSSEA